MSKYFEALDKAQQKIYSEKLCKPYDEGFEIGTKVMEEQIDRLEKENSTLSFEKVYRFTEGLTDGLWSTFNAWKTAQSIVRGTIK